MNGFILTIFCSLSLVSGGLPQGNGGGLGTLPPQEQPAASMVNKEYRVKALFLYRVAHWVTWPESNLPAKSKTISIGVVGSDPFGKELDLLRKLKPIRKRKIAVARFKRVEDLKGVQILFISSSLPDKAKKAAIAWCLKTSTVAVSESRGLVDRGCMIDLLIDKGKFKFEVNATQIKAAKLSLSSRILKMAARVIDKRKN